MKPNTAHKQTGFSLAEIMVGLAIGLLASLVIVQVMSSFERQKRVTTGSADAQTNGGIALYYITRDLQMAGYPLIGLATSPLKCTTVTFGATGKTSITPVSIIDGTTGTGDTITIRYGDTQSGGLPATIGAVTGNVIQLDNNLGCATNDNTLVINGTTCAMSVASAVPSATALTVAQTQQLLDINDTTSLANGASLSCLGKWHEVTYKVTGGNLTKADTVTGGVATPIVTGIVNLQAQYGVSAPGLLNTDPKFNTVALWVDATTSPWITPGITDRNRIKAVRIAVVARNSKMEFDDVSAACVGTTGLCAWTGSASSPAPALDITTATDPNWKKYRYRVFDTIIPLRNVIWAKGVL